MKNYVIIYAISDQNSMQLFLENLKRKFSRNKIQEGNNRLYFGFAERDLPGVKGVLQESMDMLVLDEDDYIALYYTREEEPDEINRLMIFGTSQNVETDLKKIPINVHENTLTDLLEFDFIFQKQ
jgi:hypothetical protein